MAVKTQEFNAALRKLKLIISQIQTVHNNSPKRFGVSQVYKDTQSILAQVKPIQGLLAKNSGLSAQPLNAREEAQANALIDTFVQAVSALEDSKRYTKEAIWLEKTTPPARVSDEQRAKTMSSLAKNTASRTSVPDSVIYNRPPEQEAPPEQVALPPAFEPVTQQQQQKTGGGSGGVGAGEPVQPPFPNIPKGPTSAHDWYAYMWPYTNDAMKRLENYPYVHRLDDLMRGNAARNLNSKDPRETLRLSRLADALNNTYYSNPTHLRSGVVAIGGQYLGSQGEVGSLYQMPIETEETRQMERSRGYEEAVRAAEIARQSVYRGTPLDMARKTLEGQLEASGQYSKEEIRQIGAAFDYEQRGEELKRLTRWQNFAYIVQQNHSRISIPREQVRLVMQEAERDRTKMYLLTQAFTIGEAPSVGQQNLFNAYGARLGQINALNPDGTRKDPYTLEREKNKAWYEALTTTGVDGIVEGVENVMSRPEVERFTQWIKSYVASLSPSASATESK